MRVIPRKRAWAATLAVALALAVGVGLSRWPSVVSGEEHRDKTTASGGAASAKGLSQAFRTAAAEATPAVVKIRSHTDAKPAAARSRGERSPFKSGENPFKGTPLEDFFGDDNGSNFNFNGRMPQRDGVGSGVIIDKAGIVLTNNHVVEGADAVTVRLTDGREFKATDIKTDPQSDLAVLRIKAAEDLPTAKLGDSDDLEIGDWVIAIGNPFELETTVSAGIISGKGRELGSVRRAKFLQTDAAINPGNSGGPLVNLDGEVIGINTAIASNSGGYQGIGFAIPINLAKWVTNQLIKQGSVQRAFLGVGIDDVSTDLGERLGVRSGQGVVVMEVQPNTAAADAGLKVGDVITEFDGHKIKSRRDLQELVERSPVDKKESLTVIRDGKSRDMSITLKALPTEVAESNTTTRRGDEQESDEGYYAEKLGLQVTEMSRQAKQTYKGREGLVVSRVDDDGPAASKGLRKGMLIMEVNKKPVTDLASFKEAVNNVGKDGALLLVRTAQGGQHLVVVKGS